MTIVTIASEMYCTDAEMATRLQVTYFLQMKKSCELTLMSNLHDHIYFSTSDSSQLLKLYVYFVSDMSI